MIGPSPLSAAYWQNIFWDTVEAAKSFVLKTTTNLMLRKGTPQRKLSDQRLHYILGELTTDAFNNEGVAKIDLPLKKRPWLNKLFGSDITTIMVVTNLPLVAEIGRYGEFNSENYDPQVRKFFDVFAKLSGKTLVVNKNDATVSVDRNKLKNTLAQDIVPEEIKNSIQEWLEHAMKNDIIDLTATFESVMFKFVCRALFGIKNFPPPQEFARLIKLMSEVDELIVIDSENYRLEQLKREVKRFSKWLFEHNKHTILDSKNIITDLLVDQNEIPGSNLASLTIATSNITKLNTLTLTFLAENPQWQDKVRKALLRNNKEDQAFLERFYLECCRLLMGTGNTARYVSQNCKITAKDGTSLEVEGGTLVILPHRRIQLNESNYENPMVFNPNRPEFMDKNHRIRTGDPKLAPFGVSSARVCVASGSFTQNTFMTILRQILTGYEIQKPQHSDATFTVAPADCPYIKLNQAYPVQVSKLGYSSKLFSEKLYGSESNRYTPLQQHQSTDPQKKYGIPTMNILKIEEERSKNKIYSN